MWHCIDSDGTSSDVSDICVSSNVGLVSVFKNDVKLFSPSFILVVGGGGDDDDVDVTDSSVSSFGFDKPSFGNVIVYRFVYSYGIVNSRSTEF